MPKLWHLGPLLLFTLLLAGCGPSKRSTLHGKVIFKDKPLVMGQVTVEDKDGNVRVSPIGEDGGYEVLDLVPGPVKIAVESPNPADPESGSGAGEDSDGNPKKIKGWRKIPEKYGDLNQSGLTTEVGILATEYTIVLK